MQIHTFSIKADVTPPLFSVPLCNTANGQSSGARWKHFQGKCCSSQVTVAFYDRKGAPQSWCKWLRNLGSKHHLLMETVSWANEKDYSFFFFQLPAVWRLTKVLSRCSVFSSQCSSFIRGFQARWIVNTKWIIEIVKSTHSEILAMWHGITITQPFALHRASVGLCYKVGSCNRLICKALSLPRRVDRLQRLFTEHRERLLRSARWMKRSLKIANSTFYFYGGISFFSVRGQYPRNFEPCETDTPLALTERLRGTYWHPEFPDEKTRRSLGLPLFKPFSFFRVHLPLLAF